MKSFLSFLLLGIVFNQAHGKSLDPSGLLGEYLGKPNCAVRVTLEERDMLRFSLIRIEEGYTEDTVAFYHFETVAADADSFEFEKEAFGPAGEELKVVSGSVLAGKLRSLKLKTVRGLFTSDSTSCNKLVPLMPDMPSAN